MEILAHRGHWLAKTEQNSEIAIRRAFENGFGIETDLRDLSGAIVISHDMADANAMRLEDLLTLHARAGGNQTLALNIKADGLQAPVQEALARFSVKNYFLFDMSVPDTIGYLRRKLTVYTRRSEYELGSPLDALAQGLWLDALNDDYVDPELLASVLNAGTNVAIVSPELHGKPTETAWERWRSVISKAPKNGGHVSLCTDHPERARQFFN